MVYCLFSYSQWLLIHRRKRLNFTAVKSQSATTVNQGSVWKISGKGCREKKSHNMQGMIKSSLKALKDYFWPLANKKCYILC